MSKARPPASPQQERLRSLPAVTAILARPAVACLLERHGHPAVVRAVRAALADARSALIAGGTAAGEAAHQAGAEGALRSLDDAVVGHLGGQAEGSLRAVLNATGVVLHTNLGRAPLADEALAAVARVAAGYATLEYDLAEGARGDRHVHAVALLRELTGAEDALVVNNNAAAMVLALSALATGREVVVSRGELVEIGGGFRIPDVLAQSGARLVEVGTTNRTHARDYRGAVRAETALLLKVHQSAFAMVGFTREVSVAELSALGRELGVPVMYDAGSGCLAADDPRELTVAACITQGADLVSFSGDKLLGGPQAGILVGKRSLLEPIRRHPLMRAVRPDKLCLAALSATLTLWRDAPERLPVVRMLSVSSTELGARAAAICAQIERVMPGAPLAVVQTSARVGGGASPLRELPSAGLAVSSGAPAALCARLRRGRLPVIARIDEGRVVFDLRAVPPGQDSALVGALLEALGPGVMDGG